MNDFILSRTGGNINGIFGVIESTDGSLQFATLEHAYGSGKNWSPKIPPGEYNCIRRLSPKFGYDVFMLENVPKCDFIEIHIGNYNRDSDGCILLGTAQEGVMVVNSKEAFGQFMAALEGVDSFKLTVV